MTGATAKLQDSDPPEFWTLSRFALLLVVAVIACFPLVAIGSRTFFYRDFGTMWYPVYVYTRDSLLSGHLPLWNPYIDCGVPFQAQMGQWYPPLLLGLFLPMPWSINALMLVHLAWGGAGMFWVSRRFGAVGFAAAFAGFAYVFTGVMFSSLLWMSYIGCLAWLPWVVGCVVEAWSKGGRWTVLAALCSAMQVLAGMPELTAMTWLFLAVLWLSTLIERQIQFLASAARSAGIIALAAGLTMVQILPFSDLVSHSQRNTSFGNDIWSMPMWGWANLLVPLFHCYQAPQGNWFQAGQDLVPSYYVGASLLVLAISGLFAVRNQKKWAFLFMLLFCWVMALGSNGGLYALFRLAFPQLGFARFPVKFAIFPAFLVPLMATWMITEISSKTGNKARRILLFATIGAAALMGILLCIARLHPLPNDEWNATAANTGWRTLLMVAIIGALNYSSKLADRNKRILVQVALLALIPIDAVSHSPGIAPSLPSSVMAPGFWELSGKTAPPKLGEGRIMISGAAEQALLYRTVAGREADFSGRRLAEWYNLNLLDRVPKVNGAVPLHPDHYNLVERRLYYESGAKYGPSLLDFLSVAWVSSDQNSLDWVKRKGFLPMLTAGQRPVFASPDKALNEISADTFAPQKVVYLPEGAEHLVTATNSASCSLSNILFSPERVEAETDCSTPSMVVVSQTYYHLWQASVDGNPVPLFRANVAFQALEVAAGRHRIEIIYKDYNLSLGALISAVTFGVCVLLWIKAGKSDSGFKQ